MKKYLLVLLGFAFTAVTITSCETVDLYEKWANIPKHEWKSDFVPTFKFTVKDSTTPYQLYVVLRHTQQYNYNNIYVNVWAKGPQQDSAVNIKQDLLLATNEKGWLGQGMDDIYSHMIKLGSPILLKAGDYEFKLEQIMREDPLKHVLDAGIRIEKTSM